MGKKDMHLIAEIGTAGLSWLPEPLSVDELKKKRRRGVLTGDATPEDVDGILRRLFEFLRDRPAGDIQKEEFFREIIRRMKHRDLVLAGGLCFLDGDVEIDTGCCCGLEEWVAIACGLIHRHSPWMGHNPDVSFREENGICYISTVNLAQRRIFQRDKNGKMLRGKDGRFIPVLLPAVKIRDIMQDQKEKVIGYQLEEFDSLLDKLDGEFYDFVRGPLYKRILELAPEYADRFCQAFERDFRRNKGYDFELMELCDAQEREKAMGNIEEMKKLTDALADLHESISKEDFMALSAVYFQYDRDCFIMGSIETGKAYEVCYTCTKANIAIRWPVLLYITAEEIPSEEDLKEQYPGFKDYIVMSYDSKKEDYMRDLDDLILWLFRDGHIFSGYHDGLHAYEQIKEKLAFLEEKPFTWWYRMQLME